MKKQSVFTIFLLLLSTHFALSQGTENSTLKRKTSQERADAYTKKLTKLLSLNDAQVSDVYEFNMEAARKIDEQRAIIRQKRDANTATKADRESYRSAVKTINDSRDYQTRELLNAEQKIAYDQFKEEQKAKVKARNAERTAKFKDKKNNQNIEDDLEEEDDFE